MKTRLGLLLLPYLLLFLGQASNAVATLSNGQRMPVIPPGRDCSLLKENDVIHTCLTPTTHVKYLTDIFISDEGISSVGDLLQDAGSDLRWPLLAAWLALVIRDMRRKE